jgi:hypothetical protein
MGREQAAIAIAIVSAKPAAHFRATPGGYFHGMLAKAKTVDLNLARTVWGLRQLRGRNPVMAHPGRARPDRRPGQDGGFSPVPVRAPQLLAGLPGDGKPSRTVRSLVSNGGALPNLTAGQGFKGRASLPGKPNFDHLWRV